MINDFRSPSLGIGNEALKKALRRASTEMQALEGEVLGRADKLAVYSKVLDSFRVLVDTLDEFDNHARLNQTRSVRDYRIELESLRDLLLAIDENTAKLNKSRDLVADVIWYFNDQELSTRTLEKQDSELLAHWYLNAKEEWDRFETNKGGIFTAHDQPLNKVLERTFKSEPPAPNYFSYLFTLLPVLLILALLYFVFTRQMKGHG